jgi:hypothetical protein
VLYSMNCRSLGQILKVVSEVMRRPLSLEPLGLTT